ncbi:MAG: hypothetical protein Q4G22_12405 [Paracoccus sp. (in: a-proteobacteria)]|nr:hypothetical protein [Paracoccus sp. (in: a-proteobacteria)]MDO5632623.1 hypothetical protein [Paracoccus sp. (in: a-proteobacteria)]
MKWLLSILENMQIAALHTGHIKLGGVDKRGEQFLPRHKGQAADQYPKP